MPFDYPETIGTMPFFPVEIDKKGRHVDDDQLDAAVAHIRDTGVTDLLVMVHGWNNDIEQAMSLFERLGGNIDDERPTALPGRTMAVLGVFWPSKKFADDELIPGGAASFDMDLPPDKLIEQINDLRGVFDRDDADAILDRLVELVPELGPSPMARAEFADLARRLLDDDVATDAELGDEIPEQFFTMPGDEMMNALAAPREEERTEGAPPPGAGGIVGIGGNVSTGGAASLGGAAAVGGVGEAAGLGDLFSGIRNGGAAVLNLVTYWKMKSRAGLVGRKAIAPMLRRIKDEAPRVKLHLVGHSFGGRAVSAASLGSEADDPKLPIDSVALLQAAFSHHGFAENWEGDKDGYFRKVIVDARITGPMVITHTHNDKPNTWAYPVASRLARQKAAALGGPDDEYGAIGANGAQKTPGAVNGDLLDEAAEYAFSPCGVYNLEASTYVKGHGNVTGKQVAHAIVSAIATT